MLTRCVQPDTFRKTVDPSAVVHAINLCTVHMKKPPHIEKHIGHICLVFSPLPFRCRSASHFFLLVLFTASATPKQASSQHSDYRADLAEMASWLDGGPAVQDLEAPLPQSVEAVER
jgi:hypothetical protein